MKVETKIFELCNGNYRNLSTLAQAMGISVSQIYRVRQGKRNINQKFIIGAVKAFPGHKFDDLFYLSPPTKVNTPHYSSSDKIAKGKWQKGKPNHARKTL